MPNPVSPIVPQVIYDTIWVLKTTEGIAWDKWLIPFFSVCIGSIVSMVGWKVNEKINEKKDKKSNLVTLKNMVRTELTPLFSEYQEYLNKFLKEISDTKTLVLIMKDHVSKNPVEFPEGKRLPKVSMGQLEAFLTLPLKLKFLDRLSDYSDIFKNFGLVIDRIRDDDRYLFHMTQLLLRLYQDTELSYDSVDQKLDHLQYRVIQLVRFREQLFKFFHCECLKDIDGVTDPIFYDIGSWHYLRRRSDGVIEIVNTEKEWKEKELFKGFNL